MSRFAWILIGLVAAIVVAAGWWWLGREFRIDPQDRALVASGQAIYEQHCASCHGSDFKGQPDWKSRDERGRLPAPPHDETGHTWHHDDLILFEVTKFGVGKHAPPGYQSDMPIFGDRLSDDEIVAVLAYIKSRWPETIHLKRRAGGMT
jgi:mono/diheme cytochrome c family protein